MPRSWRHMELYFPCCYDAVPVPKAPNKNQRRADKAGPVPTRHPRSGRRGATAWHGKRGPVRCLASVALLVAAACSSLDETETNARDTANEGSGAPGNSPGAVDPAPASPTNSGHPIPTSAPGGGPDESGENQGPGATETNFLTLPCNTDADCGGSRCIVPTDAGRAQSGPASNVGARDAGARDAGAGDAGPPLPFGRGRCSPGL